MIVKIQKFFKRFAKEISYYIVLLFVSIKNCPLTNTIYYPSIPQGGGLLSAKFRVGVCHPQFQNGTVGYTNVCKNDTLGLARLISLLEVHNFFKFGFFTEITELLQSLDQSCQKAYPCLD